MSCLSFTTCLLWTCAVSHPRSLPTREAHHRTPIGGFRWETRGSIPEAGGTLGQTHDKHRVPECKLVTMKHHLSLTPRQYGTATPPAQLSLGTSSTSTCHSVDLNQTATLDTITELLEKIDKASLAGSKLFSTPIADFWISVSKQHWHPLYH